MIIETIREKCYQEGLVKKEYTLTDCVQTITIHRDDVEDYNPYKLQFEEKKLKHDILIEMGKELRL